VLPVGDIDQPWTLNRYILGKNHRELTHPRGIVYGILY